MSGQSFATVAFHGDRVVMLDQTRLPSDEVYREYQTPEEVAEAIRTMVVRGAPAIGIAAAFGIALGVCRVDQAVSLDAEVERICALMATTRPTAVNLFWAIDRMKACLEASRSATLEDRKAVACAEANAILAEDVRTCRRIGEHGASLLGQDLTVMTHCNAGALATGGCGTALAVIRVAVEQGKTVRVLANETRPVLQGARLTAWELMKDDIDVTLVADNAAGSLLRSGRVGAVVVGTDRTVANGDVANKIGTYSVAVLAAENGVPFYVAAPTSTIDLSTASGDDIEIEERSGTEVTEVLGMRIAPAGVASLNPAFDVTPARYVTAIVTEAGIAYPPYEETLPPLVEAARRDTTR